MVFSVGFKRMPIKIIEKNRFFFLFIALMLFFVLNPFFVDSTEDMTVFGILFTLTLFFSVYIIKHRSRFLIIGIIFATLSLIGHWTLLFITQNKEVFVLDYIVTIIFFMIITTAVLNYVLEDKKITSSTIFGAICGYLLIGLTWSFVHLIIYTLSPDAYTMTKGLSNNPDVRVLHFIYYSFVTLSTLGFGDISPVSSAARTFSWIEAISGQIYLTVWIAQLIGLHIAQKKLK